MSGQYSPKQFFRKVSNKFLIDYLKQKNIDFFQGFLFSRPMPRDEFIDWLRKYSPCIPH